MKNNGLEQQLATLPFEPIKDLRALWLSYFNEPAPVFNKVTLVGKLAYRMTCGRRINIGTLTNPRPVRRASCLEAVFTIFRAGFFQARMVMTCRR